MNYPAQSVQKHNITDIRRARQVALKPVLISLGYQLQELRNGNYRVHRLAADIVIKDHYWVSKDHGSAGNAIDYLVDIEGFTFNRAVDLLLSFADHPDAS